MVSIRQYAEDDLPWMIAVWNEVVEDGITHTVTHSHSHQHILNEEKHDHRHE